MSPSSLSAKFRSMSPASRAAMLFTACSVLQKGIAFLLTPVYTRIMPAEAYGQYSVFLTWYQLLMVFTTLNMWNYLINNGMVQFGDDREHFISALQGLSTLLTVVWFVIYLPCSDLWAEATGLTRTMMLLMFAELLFMPSFEYYCAVKRFDYDAKPVVVLSIIITVITPIISVPLILMSDDKGLAAIVGKVVGSTVIFAGVAVYMLRGSRKFFNKEYWAYALRFNLPLVPHFLSMMVLGQVDRIMIERMCGQADAGMYSVAYQCGMALQVLNAGILSAFVPYTYKSIKSGEVDKVGEKATPLLAIIGVANGLAALIAPEVMIVLAPDSYQLAVYAIPPVALSNLFMFLFNLFSNIEYYWSETRYVAVASVIAAAANVALNYIFIDMFGFLAAGYTTLGCYLLFSVCHYVFMRIVSKRHMDGKKIYNMKAIVAICLISSMFSLGSIAVYDLPLLRYGVLVICFLVIVVFRKRVIGAVSGLMRKNA